MKIFNYNPNTRSFSSSDTYYVIERDPMSLSGRKPRVKKVYILYTGEEINEAKSNGYNPKIVKGPFNDKMLAEKERLKLATDKSNRIGNW